MFSLASSMKSSCFGLIKSDIRPLSIFTKSSSVLQSIKLNNQSNSIMNGRGSSSPFAMKVMQRRFKSRGNTYQPSTLKRKRTFGFLARLRSKNGRKILSRRAAKARWYLTH